MTTAAPRAGAMREFVVDTAFGRLTGLRCGSSGTPRVLALHGWLDNAASFVPLAAQWGDIELVALDLPGHGASAHLPPSADYTVAVDARAAFAAADALGWEHFHLLGHSLGGAVASVMAAAMPQRITRLALIEALGALAEDEARTAARLREAFAAHAHLAGKTLREARLSQDYGVMVVSIIRPTGEVTYSPPGDAVLEASATVIAIGPTRKLQEVERLTAKT